MVKKCTDCKPAFGPPGGKATTCKEHREDETWINLLVKKCASDGCTKQPCHGHPGGKAVMCAEHGNPLDMVDVKNKKCNVKGCVQPSYAKTSKEQPTFCAAHGKPLGYVDVKLAQCQAADRDITLTYGEPGSTPAHCAKHRKEACLQPIVKAKRCTVEGCDKVVLFGKEGGMPEFCREGEERGLVDVCRKQCQAEGCIVRPTYATVGASQ